jgi:hypothetical protein
MRIAELILRLEDEDATIAAQSWTIMLDIRPFGRLRDRVCGEVSTSSLERDESL